MDKAGHGISFLGDTKTKRPQDFLAAALKNSVKNLLIHARPQTSGNAPCARQAAQVHYGDRAGGGNHGAILQGEPATGQAPGRNESAPGCGRLAKTPKNDNATPEVALHWDRLLSNEKTVCLIFRQRK
ncbi:MAG: hypothetical protein JNN31_10595 [Dechloromonas sp.]|nr:hypothetical protein [Dechloromonas sp.]